MNEINYTYNLKLKVLTPLFIGAGKEKDWVRGFDFIIFKGSLYVFNQEKLFKFLSKKIFWKSILKLFLKITLIQ